MVAPFNAQAKDPVFTHYKKLAENQDWLAAVGMGHKKWTFGYGHNRDVAVTAGCDEIPDYPWEHGCLIVAKTSPDGKRLQTHSTTHFGKDHTKSPKCVHK